MVNRNSNTTRIDGTKLKSLLEERTGKTVQQIAVENGFSRNIIPNAIREGYASPVVKLLARVYGVTLEEYEEEEEEPEVIDLDELIVNLVTESNKVNDLPHESLITVSEVERLLQKVLTPLSIAIGVEVEKSLIDVLNNYCITEHIDNSGRFTYVFTTKE